MRISPNNAGKVNISDLEWDSESQGLHSGWLAFRYGYSASSEKSALVLEILTYEPNLASYSMDTRLDLTFGSWSLLFERPWLAQ